MGPKYGQQVWPRFELSILKGAGVKSRRGALGSWLMRVSG